MKFVDQIDKPIWSAAQYVEPERDGAPWCTQDDATEMLTLAAAAVMRGAAGVKATIGCFSFDEKTSVLTLQLGS